VDYCVADRSQGYAPADVRFAQWAKWTGLITPRQYEVGFLKQLRGLREDETPRPIHEVLIQQGALNQQQALSLLEFMSLPRPDETDGEFVRALMASTRVDREKVDEVQRKQLEAARRWHEVPPLCQLLLEAHVISEARMLGVLRLQEKNGRGALKIAREMALPSRGGSEGGASGRGALLRSPTVLRIAVVAGLFLIGTAVWWVHSAATTRTVYVRCRTCRLISEVRWSNTWPVKCPKCGRQSGYFAKICANGHIFTVDNPFVPQPLPAQCEGGHASPLTGEDLD
jgi:hypothetical protein